MKNEIYDAIKESLIDYVSPIFIIGGENLSFNNSILLDANMDKKDLLIVGDKEPLFYKVLKENNEINTLVIDNFDDLSLREQEYFIDLICDGMVSGECLPIDTKIVIRSKKVINLIMDIREAVEIYNLL